MSELRVDPNALRSRATSFDAEADDQRAVAAADSAGVESDIEAFGPIAEMLHGNYRAAHGLKQQAWVDHGAQTASHGAKIADSADGYDRTEAAAVADLGAVE